MTDFMKILCGRTRAGDPRARGAQFQSTCKLCQESHKTQVWLCFLVLSLLSTSCVAETGELQISVKRLKHLIEKSDATLYAPSISDIEDSCKKMTLECYMSELKMVILEEAVPDNYTDQIYHFDITALDEQSPEGGCLPCEAYPLENITVFMDRLNSLLEEMNVRQQLQNNSAET